MSTAVFAALVVSLISAGLAALLVVAGRFLTNYGECEITVNDDRRLKVQGGSSLLESLNRNSIFIPSACGGRGTCAYCKVTILEGGGTIVPVEEPYLDEQERAAGVRLSCQVKIRNNIRIRIPESLLAVKEYACVCRRIRDLTHDTKEFLLELTEPPEIKFTPGQYVQLLCPAYNGNEEVYRAYSVSSDPSMRGKIELVIRLVPDGICTTWCFKHLAEGDHVRINGPYGEFGLSNTNAPMIFIAGGSGMAPMKCLLHHMRNTGNTRRVTYFFGANFAKELFYFDLMREFEQAMPNFKFVPVVAKTEEGIPWDGESGLVTEALERNIKDASGYEGYLCGSPGMINASVKVLKKLGMSEGNIRYDKFE